MPLGMEVGLSPGDIVLDGDPSPPTERAMSVVAKWLPISATAKLLFVLFEENSLVNGQVGIPYLWHFLRALITSISHFRH